MRMPFTKYGMPQVIIFPAVLLVLMAVYWLLARRFLLPACGGTFCRTALWVPELLLLVVLIWVLCFFRDPHRAVPQDPRLLLSPADGTIVAIETLDSYEGFDGPVWRFEIFLNIFNVHLNRVPCPVKIGNITYKPGKFLDARNPLSAKVNEANEVEMFRLDEPADRLLVRQVSGAIARRIVCEAQTGQSFAAGQRFGMIKFGSCTELFVPVRENLKCTIKKGDKVKAGLAVLAEYE